MPSKNIIKIYAQDGIYHIYNRGIEKRNIFIDDQDYKVFLHLLKRYLFPFDDLGKVPPCQTERVRSCWESNLYKEIQLWCFCLMPNHFHLLLKQFTEKAIIEFMRRLTNSYTRYFNEKYKRVGALFQGSYKAVLVENEFYLLHLSRYVHANPRELFKNIEDFRKYSYSSYLNYLGDRHTKWVHPEEILSYFGKQKGDLGGDEFSSYQNFVETYSEDENRKILKNLTLD
jgi:putative transposase